MGRSETGALDGGRRGAAEPFLSFSRHRRRAAASGHLLPGVPRRGGSSKRAHARTRFHSATPLAPSLNKLTISTAQQARPKVMGHMLPVRAQLTRSSTLDTTNSAAGAGAGAVSAAAATAEVESPRDEEHAAATTAEEAGEEEDEEQASEMPAARLSRARAAATAAVGAGGGIECGRVCGGTNV